MNTETNNQMGYKGDFMVWNDSEFSKKKVSPIYERTDEKQLLEQIRKLTDITGKPCRVQIMIDDTNKYFIFYHTDKDTYSPRIQVCDSVYHCLSFIHKQIEVMRLQNG